MLNIETQTLSELVSTASDDLHMYADANMIDETKLIGEVARCNEVLGVRINKVKQLLIPITNGIGELPRDFYKAECLFSIVSQSKIGTGIIDYGNQVQQTKCEPENKCDVVGWGYHEGCLCGEDGKYWIERKPSFGNSVITINNFSPVSISNNSYMTSYSPNRGWRGNSASVDFDEGVINTSFSNGELFMSYLANFTHPDTGELLVPFHPLLNDYYLYSIKTKILENIFMNTEADVEKKLSYAKRERNLSYTDAINFVMSAKGKAWTKYNKEREREFYNKWFSLFK